MRHLKTKVASASMIFVVGCSGGQPEYEYAIPDKICNIDVEASYVKPLLPPGEEVKQRSSASTNSGAGQGCSVVVDERVDLTVSFSRQTGELDIVGEAEDKYDGLKRISLGGVVSSAAVAEDGAVAWMACKPKPGQPQYEMPDTKRGVYSHLALEIRAGEDNEKPQDVDEWRVHIEKFLRVYVSGLTKSWCA